MRRAGVLLIAACAAWSLPAGAQPIRGFPQDRVTGERTWEAQAQQIPSAEQLKIYMERMATRPHVAGTEASQQVAEYARDLMKSWGLDAKIEVFEALIPHPTTRVLEAQGVIPFTASLTEPAVLGDPDTESRDQIATFNAYGASGDVTAPVVYVNYGTPEDYDYLAARGIDVRGKIVIARYGRVWRGLKPKLAQEHGAVGCIIYSDPRDDGFYQDEEYPEGPMRPREGVQRGSVMDMVLYTGDPLSPGWASEPGSKRLRREEAATLMKIPVVPISWTDARPFLELLEGPTAPEAWRGAIPTTYHLGPSILNAHLKMDFDWSNKPLYNVLATIPGTTHGDEWIIYGNHHDAWVTGASDPVSGASVLLETARTLAELMKQGWKPERTIKLALWDGEEYGLLGSTEWAEKHAEELERHAAVYLNTDSTGTGPMSMAGSFSLERFIDDVLREVDDPASGRSIYDSMNGPAQANRTNVDQPLGALGSGSDYVAFLHHLGIASLNLGFGAAPGQYHSNYDTVRFYNEHSDGDRRFSIALTNVMTLSILRLANAEMAPFNFDPLSLQLTRQLDQIRAQTPRESGVSFDDVTRELGRMTEASKVFEAAYLVAMQRGTVSDSANRALGQVESKFLLDGGLPGREWYRHSLYAPGMLTGYSVKTIPGLREAFEARDWQTLQRETQRLADTLKRATSQIERAADRLNSGK